MLAQAEESTPLLVGQSPRLRNVLRMVEKLGRCRWPVLLLGETGTGKEVVARSIHNVSPVGPFVTIDCSSHGGSSDGKRAVRTRQGRVHRRGGPKTGLIEAANGGTAFFDEIGELPLDLQAKLLRVLQEKEFRPVGSLMQRRSDFRVIAATNRDLAKEVEKGTFRRDLFYRLERGEPPPGAAARPQRRYSRPDRALSGALQQGSHADAGNAGSHALLRLAGQRSRTRELHPAHGRHQLRTAAARERTAVHAAEPPDGQKSQFMSVAVGSNPLAKPPAEAGSHEHRATSESSRPPIVPLTQMERQAILDALEYTKGDRAVAANLLGIGRTTLYRKLKEYQLAV